MAEQKNRKKRGDGHKARRLAYQNNGRRDVNKAKRLLRHYKRQPGDVQAKKALDRLGSIIVQRAEKERRA